MVEPADPGTCCGSAGVYNLLQPEAAGRAGRPQGRLGPGHRRAAGHLGQPRLQPADLRRDDRGRGGHPARHGAHRGGPRRVAARRGGDRADRQAGARPPVTQPLAAVSRPSAGGGQPVGVEFALGHDHRRPGQPAGPRVQRHRQRTPRHRDVPLAGDGFRCGRSSAGCCRRGRDGAGTAGARLARAALVHPHAERGRPGHPDQLHVAAPGELGRVQPGRRGQVELVQRVVHQAGQVRIPDADPQAVADRATNNGPPGPEHADRAHVHGDPAVRFGPDLAGADRVATANDGPAARPCSSR